MKSFAAFLVALAATIMTSSAFSPTRTPPSTAYITTTAQPSSTALNDRLVELKRPLGIVLNEDANGNVYVETVAPRGNAARTGEVREGDIVAMCSSTFGDEMWSTRGAGLSRVLSAIRLRAGPTVKLVFENSKEGVSKAKRTEKAVKAEEAARANAKAKKDALLKELQRDEKRLKKGKFLGLF
eukprot:CAMPEP_0178676994 /NCGR_PEP_ID=MMETSP0698-20121128/36210_1 /TAXON_ID=265572 /ORGANISM="Extubocellulus spinifer, Strain CCMP396" /LENGTH=182 /DNA_ID=CAMNT_0020321265 /DNA_START=107 /DNA_END=655 /DNA_ORIENTATION=-